MFGSLNLNSMLIVGVVICLLGLFYLHKKIQNLSPVSHPPAREVPMKFMVPDAPIQQAPVQPPVPVQPVVTEKQQ